VYERRITRRSSVYRMVRNYLAGIWRHTNAFVQQGGIGGAQDKKLLFVRNETDHPF